MIRKNSDLFSGILFIGIAIAMATQIDKIKIVELAMDSRLMPQIIVVLLLAFGIPLLIRGLLHLRRGKGEPVERLDRAAILRVILSMVFFALFIFALPRLGFMLSGILYLFASFLLLTPREQHKYPLFVILSVSIPVAVYYLFLNAFKMLLPAGSLWR